MNPPGDANLLVEARSALLDACDALRDHLGAVVLVGAQAVYLHTGSAEVALAEATKDSDLALDTRDLSQDPLIERAMEAAGFYLDPTNPQPGGWRNPQGIPVDLMVPEALAGRKKRRGVDISPHGTMSARRAVGLEAAIIDRGPMEVAALADGDSRRYSINVAGPAALLVAKLHKIGERQDDPNPDRLNDKDAHDVYRLFVATPTNVLAQAIDGLAADPLSGEVTAIALDYLRSLFAASTDALGCTMAGRAEALVGDPDTVAAAVNALANDLLDAVEVSTPTDVSNGPPSAFCRAQAMGLRDIH